MLVLAAPANDNPHGHVSTIHGEMVTPHGIICDAGRDNACECVRTWVGIGSRRSTEIAEVREQDITLTDYVDLIVAYFTEPAMAWDADYAREQATHLAALAGDYVPGTLVKIRLSDDGEAHTFSAMEP